MDLVFFRIKEESPWNNISLLPSKQAPLFLRESEKKIFTVHRLFTASLSRTWLVTLFHPETEFIWSPGTNNRFSFQISFFLICLYNRDKTINAFPVSLARTALRIYRGLKSPRPSSLFPHKPVPLSFAISSTEYLNKTERKPDGLTLKVCKGCYFSDCTRKHFHDENDWKKIKHPLVQNSSYYKHTKNTLECKNLVDSSLISAWKLCIPSWRAEK